MIDLPRELNSTLADKIAFIAIASGRIHLYGLVKALPSRTSTIVPVLKRLTKYGILKRNNKRIENKIVYNISTTSKFVNDYILAQKGTQLDKKDLEAYLHTNSHDENLYNMIIRQYDKIFWLAEEGYRKQDMRKFNKEFEPMFDRNNRFLHNLPEIALRTLEDEIMLDRFLISQQKGKEYFPFVFGDSDRKLLDKLALQTHDKRQPLERI